MKTSFENSVEVTSNRTSLQAFRIQLEQHAARHPPFYALPSSQFEAAVTQFQMDLETEDAT